MLSLDQYVQDQIAKDPSFVDALEEARAELRLGLLIYELREARGWTQKKLAERAKMPQSAVARYEKAGRTPSVTMLWRFARALGVSFVVGPDLSITAVDRQPESQRTARPASDGSNRERTGRERSAQTRPKISSRRVPLPRSVATP